MKKIVVICFCCLLASEKVLCQNKSRPRTIVTTDGEVDDQDSFIRLLLYSNELNIDGLVYTSSQWHYEGDGKGTKFISEMAVTKKMYGERTELRWVGTEWMQSLIDKYAQVYSNLLKHDKNFPSPKYLKSIIRVGNIDFEGEMEYDTPGSDFIKKIELTYQWWHYEEAGTYTGKIAIQNAKAKNASLIVSEDARPGDTIHIILEVKDSGSPILTRYQRVIITVK